MIYHAFGVQMKALVDSGIIPKQLTNFGGADVFSLGGSIALGYLHPISIILVSIFAIGFTTASVAGERQRGTLEVLLARPLSRRRDGCACVTGARLAPAGRSAASTT